MKLMGQPPVTYRVIWFQKNSVPSVVMNDGIRVRTVIRPLSNPIRPAMPSTVMTESAAGTAAFKRSEEHTSELQSRPHLVCRLLLEKKKKRAFVAVVFRRLSRMFSL